MGSRGGREAGLGRQGGGGLAEAAGDVSRALPGECRRLELEAGGRDHWGPRAGEGDRQDWGEGGTQWRVPEVPGSEAPGPRTAGIKVCEGET